MVGQDIHTVSIETIWSLNPEAEKKELEKAASLRNFSFTKETINGLQTVKIIFETTAGENDKRKEFKAVIYKFLVKQDNKEYVIFFFLITDPKDFNNDNIDLLKIITTLNITPKKVLFNSQKEVNFEGVNYTISKPVDYDYFFNSVFRDMKINEFTKTYCFTDDYSIYDFELLVPKKLNENPIIHIYTMNALRNQKVTPGSFLEYKLFWKRMYEKTIYEKLLDSIMSDSVLFCKYQFSDAKPMTFTHLQDENKLLSTLVIIDAKTEIGVTKIMSITNYIYLKDIVIFIKLTKKYTAFSDIEKIKSYSNLVVSEFIKNNDK